MAVEQAGQIKHFDVLVIGSGLAGLYYSLKLSQSSPSVKIALISKTSLEECNSRYAQGGIASASGEAQAIQRHLNDTLKAGGGLCDCETTQRLLSSGPEVIRDLEALEVNFRRQSNGYDLASEGGHSEKRIYHCGDQTGQSIVDTLLKHVRQTTNITCLSHHIVVSLLKHSHKHVIRNYGEVIGAYVLDEKQGAMHTFYGKITVLATGGAGKVYRYTSNPDIATGDGIAMAYRAGARVGNMEFIQFHPTLLYHPKQNNFLISEALRGEGAKLLNADGQAFMQRYAPRDKDLATRDIVARASFSEIEKSNQSYVNLDIRHHNQSFLQQRFPQIYQTLSELGINIAKDLIPVVPAAHYICGGVLTDHLGQTDLDRLYAIGETAFTGLHGANRLASNSLLEALVMAKNAANDAATWLSKPSPIQDTHYWHEMRPVSARRASQINAHWRGLRGEMNSYAGIVRTESGLRDLYQLIKTRKRIIEQYFRKNYIARDVVELRNIILIAELIVKSALQRRESRGGHFREDYPATEAKAQESILSPHNHDVMVESEYV